MWVKVWINEDASPQNFAAQADAITLLINSDTLRPDLESRLRDAAHTIAAVLRATA